MKPPSPRSAASAPSKPHPGKTQRRRLNRGGDRQANSALYTIALARLRWDERTQADLRKKLTEGKTRRDAIRCLKRYIARELYRTIVRPPDQTHHAPVAA